MFIPYRFLLVISLPLVACFSVHATELSAAITDYENTAHALRANFNYLRQNAGSCPGSVGRPMADLMPDLMGGLQEQEATVKSIKFGAENRKSITKLIADALLAYTEMEDKLPTIRSGLADPNCQRILSAFEKTRDNSLLIRKKLAAILSVI
ncbi:MAG: hypothetical protein ACXVA9_07165 [Bdellovibrionales bacterium]